MTNMNGDLDRIKTNIIPTVILFTRNIVKIFLEFASQFTIFNYSGIRTITRNAILLS